MTKGLRYGKLSCLQSLTTSSGEVFEELYGALSKRIKKRGFRFISPEFFKEKVGPVTPSPPKFVRAAWERNGSLGYVAIGRDDEQDRFDFYGYVVGEDSDQANDLLRTLETVDDEVTTSFAAKREAARTEYDMEEKRKKKVRDLRRGLLIAVPLIFLSTVTYYLLSSYIASLGSGASGESAMFMPFFTFINGLVLAHLSLLALYYVVQLVRTELGSRRVK